MIPLKIFRQSAGGCPPLGLGFQSSLRMGSMPAQSSSLTSQIVSSGLGCLRFRGMRGSSLVAPYLTEVVVEPQAQF
jgi:hypothetical protein